MRPKKLTLPERVHYLELRPGTRPSCCRQPAKPRPPMDQEHTRWESDLGADLAGEINEEIRRRKASLIGAIVCAGIFCALIGFLAGIILGFLAAH